MRRVDLSALSVLARRWWLAALALVAVLTLAALLWTVGPWAAHTYLATQTLRVIVLAPEGGGAYTALAAQDQEDVIARSLASDALLSSNTFASRVLRALPPGATAGTIQHALRAGHSNNLVTLTASAGSPAEASALADATAHTLAAIGEAWQLPGGELGGASVRVEVAASSTSGVEDVGDERAQVGVILAKGGLVALAVLVAMGGLAVAEARRSGEEGARQPGMRAGT